ncbi:MAG: response regulator transcription factor [Acidimicrobiia bacterium]
MGSYRVHVQLSDAAFGAALSAYLDAEPGIAVTLGEADVVVVGFDRPESGKAVMVHARESNVLVIGEDDAERMLVALEAGALGYIALGASLEQVADGVRAVAEGNGVVPPVMLGALLRHVVHRRRAARADLDRLDSLTHRERQVLELLAGGHDRAEIAQRLFIATGTVRTHLMRIFRKLDVHSQNEAMAFATRCGLGNEPQEAS